MASRALLWQQTLFHPKCCRHRIWLSRPMGTVWELWVFLVELDLIIKMTKTFLRHNLLSTVHPNEATECPGSWELGWTVIHVVAGGYCAQQIYPHCFHPRMKDFVSLSSTGATRMRNHVTFSHSVGRKWLGIRIKPAFIYFSVAVIKCRDQKQLKEERGLFWLMARG